MTSKPLIGSQLEHTSTPQLDAYLSGIKEAFDLLNQELDEARKQQDEYEANYKELQELRKTVFRRKNKTDHIICQDCKEEITHNCRVAGDSPGPPLLLSSDSESSYYSTDEEGDAVFSRLGNTFSLESVKLFREERDAKMQSMDAGITAASTNEPVNSAWNLKFNTKTALSLNLVHNLMESSLCLSFSADGEYLATGSAYGRVCIFEVKTGERIRDLLLPEEEFPSYRCLKFSPNSKYLATGEAGGKVRIWTISQTRVRNIFQHGGIVNALNFSPNGQCIVSCSSDGTIRIWRLRDGFSRLFTGFQYPAWSVRFSTDGRHIASMGTGQWMLVWNVCTAHLVARWLGPRDAMQSLAFTLDGKDLLSVSWDKTVKRWDLASLNLLGITQLEDADPTTRISGMMEISRFVGRMGDISISPDGKWILSDSADMTVRIWNVHDGTLQCVLYGPGVNCSVDISPVGNYLAIADRSDQVTIWNYGHN